MCGHGTIGMVTFGIENGLIQPRTPGRFTAEVPAGKIELSYVRGDRVRSVRIRNVPSYLAVEGVSIDVPVLARSVSMCHTAAISTPSSNRKACTGARRSWRRAHPTAVADRRRLVRDQCEPVHPTDPTIRGVSHVLWADRRRARARMAETPCFTAIKPSIARRAAPAPSARLAHLHAKGRLKVGEAFVHES